MNTINQETTFETLKVIDSNPLPELPNDILRVIFESFSLEEIDPCLHVSKLWKQLIKTSYKQRIFKEFAFSPQHWNEFFGENTITQQEILKAFQLLPDTIMDILKSPCPAFAGKVIMDSHVLVWIPEEIQEKDVTLVNFGELLKQKDEFSQNQIGYRRIWSSIVKQEGTKPIQSGWVLMTSDVLPDGEDKTFEAQEIMVKNLKGSYEVPKVTEGVICILAHYLKTKKRIFSDQPLIYTHCQEYVNGKYVTIGNFQNYGILIGRITLNNNTIPDHIGIAALTRLNN